MEETYRKVFIKTEADLPKVEQEYIIHWRKGGTLYHRFSKSNSPFWAKNVDWYLQPQEQEKPSEGAESKESVKIRKEIAEEWYDEHGMDYRGMMSRHHCVRMISDYHKYASQKHLPTDACLTCDSCGAKMNLIENKFWQCPQCVNTRAK